MFYSTLSEITVLHQFLFRKNKITTIKICEFIGGAHANGIDRACLFTPSVRQCKKAVLLPLCTGVDVNYTYLQYITLREPKRGFVP